jgi:hypothetical protein
MRNLDASKWLTHSDLIKTEIKGGDKRNRYEFGLSVRLRPPENAENLDSKPNEGEAVPNAPSATPGQGAPTPAVATPAGPGGTAAPIKPAADKAGGTP